MLRSIYLTYRALIYTSFAHPFSWTQLVHAYAGQTWILQLLLLYVGRIGKTAAQEVLVNCSRPMAGHVHDCRILSHPWTVRGRPDLSVFRNKFVRRVSVAETKTRASSINLVGHPFPFPIDRLMTVLRSLQKQLPDVWLFILFHFYVFYVYLLYDFYDEYIIYRHWWFGSTFKAAVSAQTSLERLGHVTVFAANFYCLIMFTEQINDWNDCWLIWYRDDGKRVWDK